LAWSESSIFSESSAGTDSLVDKESSAGTDSLVDKESSVTSLSHNSTG